MVDQVYVNFGDHSCVGFRYIVQKQTNGNKNPTAATAGNGDSKPVLLFIMFFEFSVNVNV